VPPKIHIKVPIAIARENRILTLLPIDLSIGKIASKISPIADHTLIIANCYLFYVAKIYFKVYSAKESIK
jgi:hypothetical protein